MKKIKYIALTIFTLLILVGCTHYQKLGDVLNLKEDSIEQIIVETKMTKGNKSEITLEKKDYKKFLDKLSSYDIKEIKDEKYKGWEYFIKIKADEDIKISLTGNIMYINDKLYLTKNYYNNDFLYLFENK